MYKFFLCLFCAALCTSCSKSYKIEGASSVSMLDGKMLFIKVPTGEKWVNIDSAEVIHGLFKMKGKVDSTVLASLYMDDEVIMPLVIEPGHIEINIDNAGITIKGTPLNNSFNDFVMQKNSLDDRAYDVEHEESRLIMEGKDLQTVHSIIEKKRTELINQMNDLTKGFIQKNYGNVLGPGVFLMWCNGLPYPILTPPMEEVVNQAPDSFKNHPGVKEYIRIARENMERMKVNQSRMTDSPAPPPSYRR